MDNYLHSPLDCSNYSLFNPLPFSHSRYLGVKIRQFRNRNKSSFPFISGDTIASLTDYIAYGKLKNEKIDLEKIAKAKSVFVPGDMLTRFLVESEGCLGADTLVTGNGDQNFENVFQVPKSIKLWLCQNNGMPPRDGLLTLPIGLENLRLGRINLKHYLQQREFNAVNNKVLIPPMSPSNLIRHKVVFESMLRPNIFDVEKKMLPLNEYFSKAKRYHFIFCCEGNGFDTHRLWETLYQGSFPVMLESNWSLSLKYLKLPILYVKTLEEINIEKLTIFSNEHANYNPVKLDSLWIPYWKSIISSGLSSTFVM